MATRLYPSTTDIATIEALAGVPCGTSAVLAELQAQGAQLGDDFEAYKLVHDHAHAGALDSFQTFGWGRLQGWRVVQEAGLDPVCGGTDDPALVRAIGEAQDLTDREIDLLIRTGGCWWS